MRFEIASSESAPSVRNHRVMDGLLLGLWPFVVGSVDENRTEPIRAATILRERWVGYADRFVA